MKATKAMRILTVVGTVLLALPIGFMLVTSVIGSIMRKQFLMDYMIPAELFLLVLAGAVILVVAAFRTGLNKKQTLLCLAGTCAALLACQGLAVVTGLASGRTAAEGLPLYAVMGLLIVYDVMVVVDIIGGIILFMKERARV